MTTVGVLHPGAMGSSIGAAFAANGHEVLWASAARSPATRRRAEADGLVDALTIAALVDRAEVLVSVCPPAAAPGVAASVAELEFGGTYVDANATSPATARRVGEVITGSGATFVDGGIIGPPARTSGLTLLYLSGGVGDSRQVEALLDGSPVEVVVLEAPVGAASATKMAFAAWTKGSSALLLAVRALAEHEGVTAGLTHAWNTLAPEVPARVEATAAGTAPKAWRFEGEMREIAATFAAAGLPDGFHEAAAEVYGALAELRDRDDVRLDEVLDRLTGP